MYWVWGQIGKGKFSTHGQESKESWRGKQSAQIQIIGIKIFSLNGGSWVKKKLLVEIKSTNEKNQIKLKIKHIWERR